MEDLHECATVECKRGELAYCMENLRLYFLILLPYFLNVGINELHQIANLAVFSR
jgi:hypothetical protein